MAYEQGFLDAMGEFFKELYNIVLSNLHEYTKGLFSSLMSGFAGWAELFVAIYVIIVGFNLLRGNYRETTKEAATSVVLIIFLHSIMFESSTYFNWVVDPFISIPKDLSVFFISKGSSSLTGATNFDDILTQIGKMFVNILKFSDNATPNDSFLVNAWLYFQRIIALAILFIAFSICVGTFMALQIMATIAQYILLIIGGICIFFASFKGTRFVFWSWLRAMFNYSLVIIFSSIVLSITFSAISDSIAKLGMIDVERDGVFTVPYFATVALCFISFFVLLKTTDFAAAISGGQAGSTSGIAGGIGFVAGNLGGIGAAGARHATNFTALAARGVGKGAIKAFSKLKGFGG